MDTTPQKPSENGQPGSLRSGDLFGASSRKEKAWREYKNAECFDSDGRANGFSKGFDAGLASHPITSEKWHKVLGERDHLLGALRAIQRIWQTQSEACADNSRAGELMAQEARNATSYLDSPNAEGETRRPSAPHSP